MNNVNKDEKKAKPSTQRVASLSRRQIIRQTGTPGETPDPTPVEIPVNAHMPISLRDEMMRFIRTEISKQANHDQNETFEEFDDFSIDDEEPDLTSQYTVQAHDEPNAYLLEPEPDATDQESAQNQEPEAEPSPEDRSEATGAEGADNAPAPGGLTNKSSAG